MAGLIHIYTGDGKGKTTASVGLSIRFAGSGGKVLFTQFLKDGSSSEIKVLKSVPGIDVFSYTVHHGFSFRMNEEEKERARKGYTGYFSEIQNKIRDDHYGLLVMDEIIGASGCGFVATEDIVTFLRNKPEDLEVVLTGRDPDEKLKELADYITEMKMIRHPFEKGIAARKGVEL